MVDPVRSGAAYVWKLGVTPVGDAERLMSKAVVLRQRSEIPDLVFFLAHPKTVALGFKDIAMHKPPDLLVPVQTLEKGGVQIVRSLRGGGITYHWPGQVVCYPILKLNPCERNVPSLMTRLEQVATEALSSFGVKASRNHQSPAHIGLWCDGRKVVSMGIRIDHWVTSFGFAINLEGDHGPSRLIRPCGIPGVSLVTVEEILGSAPPRPWVIQAVKESFASVFSRVLSEAPTSLQDIIGQESGQEAEANKGK